MLSDTHQRMTSVKISRIASLATDELELRTDRGAVHRKFSSRATCESAKEYGLYGRQARRMANAPVVRNIRGAIARRR
jgi:hypothetical protein